MSLIRRELNIFSGIYWLFEFFLCVWIAFHILCPFLGWFVHIYSYWFVWALCKIRKLSFCLLYLLQISCTILSFVSWHHGIYFHKGILIFMWSNLLIFWFMETSLMREESAMRLPTSLPSWSFVEPERVGVNRGWDRVDGMCVSCVSTGCELGGGAGSAAPTDLGQHSLHISPLWQKTAHRSDLYPHRNALSRASSPFVRSDHGEVTADHQANFITLTSRRSIWNFLSLSSWGTTVLLTIFK